MTFQNIDLSSWDTLYMWNTVRRRIMKVRTHEHYDTHVVEHYEDGSGARY
jgi:hypothetical protein